MNPTPPPRPTSRDVALRALALARENTRLEQQRDQAAKAARLLDDALARMLTLPRTRRSQQAASGSHGTERDYQFHKHGHPCTEDGLCDACRSAHATVHDVQATRQRARCILRGEIT